MHYRRVCKTDIKEIIMVRINCFVQVTDAAKRDEVINNAKALVAESLKSDKGCKSYDFFASSTRDDVFMFCETWESQADLDAHSATEHFKKYVGAIEKVSKVSIESFTH